MLFRSFLPFISTYSASPRSINALQVGAANQGAAAEMANNAQTQEQLDARGFNPNDPSYQAAMRRNQQQRQMGNQAANLSINQNANVANSAYQMQAIGQANSQRGRQQQAQQAAAQMATNALNQVSSADSNNGNQTWKQLPSWVDYSQQSQTKSPATRNTQITMPPASSSGGFGRK